MAIAPGGGFTEGNRAKQESGRQSRLFENKPAKNFCLLEVMATPVPTPQFSESFLLLFFKKAALAFFARLIRRFTGRPLTRSDSGHKDYET